MLNHFSPLNQIPFSRPANPSQLVIAARQLSDTLELPCEIQFVEGQGEFGLRQERLFRLRWWSGADEPLRAKQQFAKTTMYNRALAGRSYKRLKYAWQQAEQVVNSSRWRIHFRNFLRDLAPADKAYLRLAFRASQQIWSRAIRWHFTMGTDVPSPFIPSINLLSMGAWPMGCHKQVFRIFYWNRRRTCSLQSSGTFPIDDSSQTRKGLFLSAKFRDVSATTPWQEALDQHGWSTFHGQVREDLEPPEAQLGRRIQSATAVISILKRPDPDFGLPWWMFQEIDYARACNRPVVLVCDQTPDPVELEGIQKVYTRREFRPRDDHEIWDWLSVNAA